MSRLIGAAPRTELERRWDLVRKRLRDRQIDALVVLGQLNDLDGAVRWLTDAGIGYRKVIVFHANDLMTLYEHGQEGSVKDMDGNGPGYAGVGKVYGMPTFPSIDYTSDYEARAVCELIQKHGYRRIALYHPSGMPVGFHNTLRDQLTNVEFVNETEFFDHAKAIKSPAEIAVLERAAAIQDTIFERTVAYAKPGMRDRDIAAYITYQSRLLDGDHGIVSVGSAPAGEPAFYRHGEQQGRVIQNGDTIAILVENGSPGGYYVEVSRMVTVGPPPSALVNVFAHAKEAQEYTLTLMKPGVKAADVYAGYTEYLRKLGYPPEKRVFAHGQGYDLVERPLIRGDETMTLEAGMCMAVHPGLFANNAWAVVCDDVIIEANGPRFIHKTPRKIFQI